MKTKFNILDPTEIEALGELTETLVKVNRSAAVAKGGRRFSFSALSVVGNRSGVVGYGFGKAQQVPSAIEKAAKDGRKNLVRVPVVNQSIPHEVTGHFCGSEVRLLPAGPGTGIIACASVRAVVEMAGISNILTKSYGSTNPMNLVKATLSALSSLRTREEVASLRGVQL